MADSEIHVATGQPAIDAALSRPGAVEIVRHDPRTEEQISAHQAMRQVLIDELTAVGLHDLVPEVDRNLFGLAADERVPAGLQTTFLALEQLPQPVAVVAWELPGR
jgi:hypothetical protein